MEGNSYYGYSMSVNAKNAYANNEKPLTKWTKSDIMSLVKKTYGDKAFEHFKSFDLKQLKDIFLTNSGRHHTSKYYNKTQFYEFDELFTLDDLLAYTKVEKVKIKKPKETPLYITALINRVYKVNRGSKAHPKIYKVSECFVATYMSNDKRVNGYNLSSDNIKVLYQKTQKTKYFNRYNFSELKIVKELKVKYTFDEKEVYYKR